MTVLLNNTILSSFSVISRPDLVRAAFGVETVATAEAVIAEHQRGVTEGYFRELDWRWLTLLSMTVAEEEVAKQIGEQLGRGEASCIAIAKARRAKFATDDRQARELARRLGIPLTGTLGILALLARDGTLNIAEADSLLAEMIRAGFYAPITSLSQILSS